ncbi:MAG: hypothetical protein SPJ11_09305 [Coprococcus catus]|nr:hypothetical protein [Coprococcus catus]
MAQWQPSTFTPDKTADTAAYAASLSASATSQSLNRTFLSSLFEQIFNSPSEALSLYNAINGTNYSDPGLLTITTLSGALFLGYRNDVSFLIGTTLNLYEHQSSFNPNMPIRGLTYMARLYEGYILETGLDVYSSILLKLPKAQFFVFYNGTTEQPDRLVLRLSDSYPDDGLENHLEVCAIMLNINYGHNKALMEKCQTLHDYALFVDTVRHYISSGYTRERAVEIAVEECISNNVLKEFLIRNKAEVLTMLYSEYAWELHLRKLQEEGLEEGLQKGLEEGRQKGLEEGRQQGLQKGLEEGRQQGLQKGLEEGRQQGLKEGLKEGQQKGLKEGQRLSRIEDILELLSEIGCIPDDIRERITSETHLDTLKQWSRNAARCQNLEEFIERM